MTYNYDKLWKLLIDRKMTKTEMRIQAGISTNMLAKMGKEEPVTMEALAKICTILNCGFDDIVDVRSEKSFSFSETTQYDISSATARNWKKLNAKPEGRLTTRANKRKSKKRVLPVEYISNKGNVSFLQNVLDYIDDH